MEVLFNTLKWSAVVGGTVLLLLLCKPGLEKCYRAKWRYWLWLALAMFLVLAPVPWSVILPNTLRIQPAIVLEVPAASGEQLTERVAGEPSGTLLSAGVGNLSEAAGDNSVGHVPSGNPFHEGTDDGFVTSLSENSETGKIMRALPAVWLVGSGIFVLWYLCGSLAFLYRVRSCTEVGEAMRSLYSEICAQMGIAHAPRLLLCPQVDSPMLVGLFHPRLLLPEEDYGTQELAFILRHELVHDRRHDLWYKLFLLAANALHWFNPLVYLMVREANRDLELTCDDAVVANEPVEVRRAYSETLFTNLDRQKKRRASYSALSTYFHGGVGTMKARFRNILGNDGRRRGVTVLVLALLLTMAVGCGVRVEGKENPTAASKADESGQTSKQEDVENIGESSTPSKETGGQELVFMGLEDDKVCLMLNPTEKLLEVGDGEWYYMPEDQEVWLAAWEQTCARVIGEGERMPEDRQSGIAVVYQGQYLYLMEDQDIVMYVSGRGWGRIAADDCAMLRGLCEETVCELGLSEPVAPEQLQGIKKATLHWKKEDIVLTDSGSLAKLESWLSDSEYLPGGAGCWFTAGLTLELENGRSVMLAMATDSCCTWVSEGVYYKYNGSAYRRDSGGSDNQKFYELFGIGADELRFPPGVDGM